MYFAAPQVLTAQGYIWANLGPLTPYSRSGTQLGDSRGHCGHLRVVEPPGERWFPGGFVHPPEGVGCVFNGSSLSWG